MTWLTTKELYSLFLTCDWWKNLSRRKRRMHPRCERCAGIELLQAHHKFYRDNWFDTQLSDLQTLCRSCHQSEHSDQPERRSAVAEKVNNKIAIQAPLGVDLSNMEGLRRAWIDGKITKEQFKRYRRFHCQLPGKPGKKKRPNRIQRAIRAMKT